MASRKNLNELIADKLREGGGRGVKNRIMSLFRTPNQRITIFALLCILKTETKFLIFGVVNHPPEQNVHPKVTFYKA